jgi:hypothetical protein
MTDAYCCIHALLNRIVKIWIENLMKNDFMFACTFLIKWKTKKYHTVRTVPKSNREIVETETKSIPLTHMRSLSWFCAVISIKSGGVLLVLWSQTCHFRELMLSWKCWCCHVSVDVVMQVYSTRRQIPTLTYTWVSNFAINERFNLKLYAYTRHNSCHMS